MPHYQNLIQFPLDLQAINLLKRHQKVGESLAMTAKRICIEKLGTEDKPTPSIDEAIAQASTIIEGLEPESLYKIARKNILLQLSKDKQKIKVFIGNDSEARLKRYQAIFIWDKNIWKSESRTNFGTKTKSKWETIATSEKPAEALLVLSCLSKFNLTIDPEKQVVTDNSLSKDLIQAC